MTQYSCGVEMTLDFCPKMSYINKANSERAVGRAFLLEVVMKFYKK